MNNKRKGRRVQGGWAGASNKKSPDHKTSNSQKSQPSDVDVKFLSSSEYKMPAKKPENFSWIVDDLLAGSAIPWEPAHFQYYLDNNMKTLVTFTEFKPPMQYAPAGLRHIFMPVVEFEAPSVQQLEEFTNLVEKAKEDGEAICAHCHWGRGRTGTFLAAYLVACRGYNPRQAIGELRTRRPHSIETYEQEDAIWDFAEHLQKKKQPEQEEQEEEQSEGASSEKCKATESLQKNISDMKFEDGATWEDEESRE